MSDNRLSGRFSRRGFLAAAGAGATVPLAGCGGDDGEEPIRIGGTYLLSGLAEALGAGSAAAAEVAVEKINENGGILDREVEIEIRDHGDDPQAQVRSLVQEFEADVLLGMTSSGVTLNTGPTWEELGVPITLTDIGTPWPTEHDVDSFGEYYGGDGTAAGLPNLFRTNTHTAHMTYAIAQHTVDNHSDITRIANMGPDYAYGEQTWEYYQAFLDGLGFDYEVVAEEFPALGEGDMTPNLTNVMGADPDIVFTSFWAGDTVTFTSQALEAGLFEEVEDVYDTLGASADNFEALGDTMPEGFSYGGWYYPGAYGTDADEEFIERYQNAYEDDDTVTGHPTVMGASTWTAVHIYRDAIEETGGTDPDEIIEFMEGYTSDDDPRGPSPISEDNHQAASSVVIGETSFDADVPYDGAGLVNTEQYEIERDEALDLLEGTNLPPGM